MSEPEPQWSHRNQKPGWDCTREDDHEGPCALVPRLFEQRTAWHRNMGPPEICPENECGGTGIVFRSQSDDTDYAEMYCACPAGRKKKELEQDGDAGNS